MDVDGRTMRFCRRAWCSTRAGCGTVLILGRSSLRTRREAWRGCRRCSSTWTQLFCAGWAVRDERSGRPLTWGSSGKRDIEQLLLAVDQRDVSEHGRASGHPVGAERRTLGAWIRLNRPAPHHREEVPLGFTDPADVVLVFVAAAKAFVEGCAQQLHVDLREVIAGLRHLARADDDDHW